MNKLSQSLQVAFKNVNLKEIPSSKKEYYLNGNVERFSSPCRQYPK